MQLPIILLIAATVTFLYNRFLAYKKASRNAGMGALAD
jgi:hypothetical protein